MNSSLLQRVIKPALLIVITLTLYAQTFNDPFHFDDTTTIVENRAVHYLPDLGRTVREILVFQPSRFVTNLTFALNYYFHRLDVFGYHAVNVLVHVITGFLVWGLAAFLERYWAVVPVEKKSGKKKLAVRTSEEIPQSLFPFLAAVLFLAHPVNAQAVTYISQRSESMAAMFYLASVYCYLKGRTAVDGRGFFAGAMVCGFLATFSKETAVTLPLMIIAAEFFFFQDRSGKNNIPLKIIVPALIAVFILFVPAAFHFQYAQKLFVPYLSQSHLGDVLTFGTYLITQINVFAVFLRLVFVPAGLNLDHDFPMARSLFEPLVLFNLGVLSATIYAAWRWRKQYPAMAFAVLWFYVTLLSNLVPRAHVMFEHKLYLALAGFIPAFVIGLKTAGKDLLLLRTGLVGVIVLFAGLTFLRNQVWQSEIALWEDVRGKSPQKARVHLNLGTAYALAGEYAKAVPSLTRAMELMGEPYLPLINRGAVYVKMKQDDLAFKDFDEALRINPKGLNGYINRGEVFARRKDYSSAMRDFETAIAINAQFAPGYKMRGRIFEALGQYDKALEDYDRALHWEPADPQTLTWRGFALAVLGRMPEAFESFNAAIRLDPEFPEAYAYRGMYFKDHGQTAAALKDFNKAVGLNPSFAYGFYQRAVFYFSAGDFAEALKDADRAIALDDHLDLAYGLRALLHAQNKNFDAAFDDFNRALRLNPDFVEVYMNRGSLHLLTDRPQKAVEDFTQAIRLNPQAANAYSKRGGAYGHLGQFEPAVRDFTKAIELNPRQGADYYNRSVIYKEFQKRELALKDALKARDLGFPVSDSYLQSLN